MWLAVIVSIGSYALLHVLLRYMSAVRVSSLTYLVPPVTLLQGAMIFDVSISLTDITALLLACLAIYLINHRPGKAQADVAPANQPRMVSQVDSIHSNVMAIKTNALYKHYRQTQAQYTIQRSSS